MTSNDAGATSSSINSPIAPSPMPTLSPAPSLTLSPVSTTSGSLIHRPFAGGLLRLTIDYERGRIVVLDRERLEEASCECCGIVREQYRRILGWAPAA